MINPVKISQLITTGIATVDHVFLGVRDGQTQLLRWSDLLPTDLLLFSKAGGTTKSTPFSTLESIFDGQTPIAIQQDRQGFKISELEQTEVLTPTDTFVLGEPNLQISPLDSEYASVTESKLKRITFTNILALLSPDVLETVTLFTESYPNDTAAPVLECELYRIAQGNLYGFVSPQGGLLIRKVGAACTNRYSNNADAIAGGLSVGDVYSVTVDNDYGIHSAGGRGIAVVVDSNGQTPNYKGPFSSHAEADTAGVLISEAYIASPNHEWGFVGGGHALVVRTQ